MDLILWRHAEAEDGFPDSARNLTKKGIDQARRMADWLRSELPDDAVMIVSPAQRTQQTAQALRNDFITKDEIGPGASVKDILDAIGWPDASGAVIVVRHQPSLGAVEKELIPVIPAGLRMKKGSVWWIRCQGKDHAEPVLHVVKYPDRV